MSNEQAPECCPFCGAAMIGSRSTDGEYARYKCGNAFDVQNKFSRGYQSEACATAERNHLSAELEYALARLSECTAERERLTRERDEASETIRLQHELIKTAERRALQKGQEEREQLLARVKHLESEWSGLEPLQKEWFGDKYAAMQPWDAVRARIEDTEARVKRLEEAGDAIVDHNIGCGCGQDGPCRSCRMACEAWTKAKEATP